MLRPTSLSEVSISYHFQACVDILKLILIILTARTDLITLLDMAKIRQSVRCPSCGGPLQPAVLACRGCDLRVEADFTSNEFASLSDEDLHFLRIFIHTEGHIRDMESALGVSYPTVKGRLADLKGKLQMGSEAQTIAEPGDVDDILRTLRDLESGKVNYEQAIGRLKQGENRKRK